MDTRNFKDDAGNRYFSKPWRGWLNIILQLRGNQYDRNIGTLNEETKTLTVKRDPQKHTFEKTNWYWFNYELISRLQNDWKVIIKQVGERIIYLTTVWDIKEKWIFLNFVKQWFEVQQILAKSEMEKDIILK